jgi:methylenetetrahydrofolate dehydrogenase (NADP+) / methenyltetrahydrofolate cyclohydrolase
MTAKILSARPLVDEIKQRLKLRCIDLKNQGTQPTMSVVLVGHNRASLRYIHNKKKICEEVGASFRLIQLPEDVSENDFLKCIEQLNKDSSVHGIIIQLPVGPHLKKLDLPNLINPAKDIDGFNGQNTQAIYAGTTNLELLLPCTPKGIIKLLQYYGTNLSGKHVVVIGRSLIVGKPLSMLLTNFNATVSLAHSHTLNLAQLTQQADIIVTAIGKAHFLTKDYLNIQRKTIVVDVGMNTLKEKVAGDVAPDVAITAAAVTPVPGGVGPMTVICLIENLITATENQLKGSL